MRMQTLVKTAPVRTETAHPEVSFVSMPYFHWNKNKQHKKTSIVFLFQFSFWGIWKIPKHINLWEFFFIVSYDSVFLGKGSIRATRALCLGRLGPHFSRVFGYCPFSILPYHKKYNFSAQIFLRDNKTINYRSTTIKVLALPWKYHILLAALQVPRLQ